MHGSAPDSCLGDAKGLQDHRPSRDDTNAIVSVGISLQKYSQLSDEGFGMRLVYFLHGPFSLLCFEKLRYIFGK